MPCSGSLKFFLKVEKGKIIDVKFLSSGCPYTLGSAHYIVRHTTGLSLAAAKRYVPPKGACSHLAVTDFQEAVADHQKSLKTKHPALRQ